MFLWCYSFPFRLRPDRKHSPFAATGYSFIFHLNKHIFTMNFSKLHPMLLVALAGASLIFPSCLKDKDEPSDAKGQLNLEITDGPSDDPYVKAVFVTVAEVKVDGQTFSGFTAKKTINLLSYQQGSVAALGLGDITAGSHQKITLVLDTQSDANGNSPGCYVQTLDNVKHALSTSATESVTASNNFVVSAGTKTNVVLDFDLRKAVEYQTGGGVDQYNFVDSVKLQAALRLVVKDKAGTINGTCQNSIVNTDKIVAYVYKKGEFDRTVELKSENGIAFKNAVASTIVNSNGEFKVAFVEGGDYEIHFAAYKDLNSDDKLDFQGTLILDSLIDLGNIQLGAGASLKLTITVIGILP